MDNAGAKKKDARIYYAHSHPDFPDDPTKWQKLEDHLRGTAELARKFAEPFGCGDWAWNAGWLHDLGKATNAFQSYLARCNELDDSAYDADGSISNHASAGAAWAMKEYGKRAGKLLAYLGGGHHAGLPDWFSSETGNAALPIRLKEGHKNLEFVYDYATEIKQHLCKDLRPPPYVSKNDNFHLWIRMMFSCLVDADFIDTERFLDPQKAANRGGYSSLTQIADKLYAAVDILEKNAPDTPVNKVRAEVRDACEKTAESPTGLFSLSVPTGGGKTLSTTAFALRHALRNDQRRIIYVIPYTSIIEQTARVLIKILGSENVIEHHSNLSPDRESPRSRLAAENWDAPIIVTTNVQFFESLYSAKSSRCRKLHNIVNSVVILDEAQLLPPKWLDPCVAVMNQLVRHYGVSMVLATATQPVLPGLDICTPIVPEDMYLYSRLKRTTYKLPADCSKRSEWSDVAAELQQHRRVLCVVNTRRDCYELFKLMPEGTIHLSALMCGRHRSAVIRLIKTRLKKGLPVRVISTQLVEAGVDLDFPVVYRALAGLDSIAQAAGRCNREGRLNEVGRTGLVRVFLPPKSAPPGLLRKGEDRTREMMTLPNLDLHNPSVFPQYFGQFYSSVNDTGKAWLNDLLFKDAIPELAFQFRTAGQQFRLIDQIGQPVFVRYAKSHKWINQLRSIGPTRENLRALQRYTVNVSKHDFERAREEGLVEDLWGGTFWCWAPTYDKVLGVDVYGAGWAVEDLIH